MFKNPTLREIALYSSILITAIFLGIYGISVAIDLQTNNVLLSILLVLTCFIASYFVVLFIVKIFVHERIKLIYKNIHTVKLREGAQASIASNNAMDQVEKDVNDFVTDQVQEIKSLKSMENYRREFLGNVSHELKTPIFNIQGYVHTLIEGGVYDSNINIDYLQRAAKNADRLKIIVDDLTEISKLESGQLQLDMEEFDIKRLVEEVYKDQEFSALAKKISFVFNDAADKNFRVKADKKSIRQVLMNLVSNAVKYNKEGGRVKTSFYVMGKNILIEVSDNGSGIEKKHLSHLFERFYRADTHRSRKIGGSGLGLSIVKHIIEAHQQTINVRSTINLGTTFGFTVKKAN